MQTDEKVSLVFCTIENKTFLKRCMCLIIRKIHLSMFISIPVHHLIIFIMVAKFLAKYLSYQYVGKNLTAV